MIQLKTYLLRNSFRTLILQGQNTSLQLPLNSVLRTEDIRNIKLNQAKVGGGSVMRQLYRCTINDHMKKFRTTIKCTNKINIGNLRQMFKKVKKLHSINAKFIIKKVPSVGKGKRRGKDNTCFTCDFYIKNQVT